MVFRTFSVLREILLIATFIEEKIENWQCVGPAIYLGVNGDSLFTGVTAFSHQHNTMLQHYSGAPTAIKRMFYLHIILGSVFYRGFVSLFILWGKQQAESRTQ